MKTNHRDGTVARRARSAGYFGPANRNLKFYTVRSRRVNEREVLNTLRVGGYLNTDEAVFAIDIELENPWNWD